MKQTQKSIYEFKDYRAYLQIALPVKGVDRGSRARLALFLGCQNAFISQVMTGVAEFSLEHAVKVSRFLEHTKAEKSYFILLVQFARAGSKELSDHIEEQIDAVLVAKREIKERVEAKQVSLTDSGRMIYYSSWHYTAIHMCLVNPHTQTKKEIAEHLKIPIEQTAKILEDLVQIGLASQEGDRFIGNYDRIHLPADSPLISKHHTNWRMRTIHSLDFQRKQDLHYSLVMSISRTAAEKMREILLRSIREMEPVMKEAKDEEVFALTLDLFDVRG